jgi:hypothetical protein
VRAPLFGVCHVASARARARVFAGYALGSSRISAPRNARPSLRTGGSLLKPMELPLTMRARLPTHLPVPLELLFLSLSPPACSSAREARRATQKSSTSHALARSAMQAALEAPAAKRTGDEAARLPARREKVACPQRRAASERNQNTRRRTARRRRRRSAGRETRGDDAGSAPAQQDPRGAPAVPAPPSSATSSRGRAERNAWSAGASAAKRAATTRAGPQHSTTREALAVQHQEGRRGRHRARPPSTRRSAFHEQLEA